MKGKRLDAVIRSVVEAERRFGPGNGMKKRDFAVLLISAVVDIPFIPEWAERIVIGLLVDLTIRLFNRTFGKRWIDRIGRDEKDKAAVGGKLRQSEKDEEL